MFNINFAFFGTDHFAVLVLEELEKRGLLPALIIAVPDKPQGKKQLVIPSPVKDWAHKRGIEVIQPEKLDDNFSLQLKAKSSDLFIVASYGKIIPQKILDIPKYKTLNIHPSLLPKLRGPSPLEYAILEEKKTGVTIIRLDSEMDHGPIVAQAESLLTLPVKRSELETELAKLGAELLTRILPDWIKGTLIEKEQNHTEATFTEKIKKEDGLVDVNKSMESYRKILAFEGWPGTFFFTERNGKKIRILVLEAHLEEDGTLTIIRIKPEGKKEMFYKDFLRGERN